ncbi:alpha/beta hydrolase [Aliarcobacter butzleri]|uniref:alpha/beta hydrolase n=1 Tax=Aliarcobacter butzleri TaxID=28197 RepID=UPI001EDC435C|nr:alpha/beta hydrolase-fold protein [Aliarcobacter butzleri]MCG3689262.1 prolyl oligopeptidase family serine peptidase [Aliarcobacter butzleri]MCG3697477.1 prolyl oligopeptidase family serine peptidase [Aliarcobacter butzleri]MCG3699004.1 prolyl oligopeptidase family serine peptidase [Aliarcobacter butzleri]MCG3718138.1 prolyl oligopeptidase family serine peptidase [Aliarcobacter butzleri]MCT7581765.1 alpha/beta hydrolase-fold protein [Aliarcobacter butzleri]
MKNLIKLLFLIPFLSIYLFANADINIQKGVLLIGEEQNQEFTISSKFHEQDYLIQVYKPKAEAPKDGYEVVYILDGNATFPYASLKAQGMDKNSRANKTPPLIVAIGYTSKELFDVKARSFDYTPPYNGELKFPENRGSSQFTQGGADKFYSFIQKQLKLVIEENYPINTKKQTLFGHSYGGLFTLYAFLNHNEDFQNFIAASPSIWWNDFFILNQLKNKNLEVKNPTRLYLSVGEIENKEKNPSDIETFSSYLKNTQNLKIKILNISNASHLEALFPALNEIFKLESIE